MRIPHALLVLTLTACSALPRAGDASTPDLRAAVQPDVRVVALQVRPCPEGWRLSGQVVLPQPVRPGIGAARVEGLDAQGQVLVAADVLLDLAPAGPRVRPRAALSAVLPAAEGLRELRLSLPSGR
jgi:hypothetical protein